MNFLLEQQQALLKQVFASRLEANSQNDRGLAAYRSNASGIARSALAAAYPVMRQLLGAASFDQLAPVLWRSHPPQRGDLAQWGGALTDFLAGYEKLMDEHPYLPDVARVEWKLHQMAAFADVAMDTESFGLMTEREPEEVRLVLATGAECLESAYPVASMVLAHRQVHSESDVPDLNVVWHMLEAGQGETALLWRQGFKPVLRVVQASEKVFIRTVLSGASLGVALDKANADFDFVQWLQQAVADKIVLGATLLKIKN